MKDLIFLLVAIPCVLHAQLEHRVHPTDSTEVIEVYHIPKGVNLDSLVRYLYDFNPSQYGIEHSQKFGWLKTSHKFDANEFYEWTKQYCIERVGEQYFYDNFRLDRRSINDDAASEIFQIRYYYFPPGFHFDHQ